AYEAGGAALEGQQFDTARRIFEDLLEAEPQFIPARILLGECRQLAGDGAAAVEVWRDGFRATGSPTFLQRIEDHFIEQGDPVGAIESLRGLIAAGRAPAEPGGEVAGTDLLPRFFLGRLYHRLAMRDEALRVLDGLEERIRNSPTFHLMLARIQERRGDAAAAL